ncbi:nucleoside 2-deoxyribosyltransferase [Flammeovirga pacifica]|uniref:Nucleoside 2-deoxyribosyltransferase n=1 Tax=Flammeovirga pacifica TaxID=915059 RepID=A0A1S1YZI4_FLAPC|nr:nucleoside 2-deoxyribosyltransferase [Flammeovirga pacifica]OHX66408.1 hypothetical protein NH26_08590 [Flammeovirga pacifica]
MKSKKAYLGISFSNRKLFSKEVNALQNTLNQKKIELMVFVDKYRFEPHQEVEMMQTAFQEIEQCDVFIAELTSKAIGVGIELGYAYKLGLPIIYIRKTGSEYSTTAAGCAQEIYEYEDDLDLSNYLSQIIPQLLK